MWVLPHTSPSVCAVDKYYYIWSFLQGGSSGSEALASHWSWSQILKKSRLSSYSTHLLTIPCHCLSPDFWLLLPCPLVLWATTPLMPELLSALQILLCLAQHQTQISPGIDACWLIFHSIQLLIPSFISGQRKKSHSPLYCSLNV